MITRRLVRPAYWSIRLMDILNYIPVSLDLQTGKIAYKGQLINRILYYLLFYTSVLKCLQLSYALLWLLVDFEIRSLHVVILTALWLSLVGIATFWGTELFQSRLAETIILFNSLEYAPPVQLEAEADRIARPPPNGSKFARKVKGYLRSRKVLSLVLRRRKIGVKNVKSLTQLILSLDLQEFLCIMTPFAVKMFVPLYIAMMVAFASWSIFSTSLVRRFSGVWWNLAKVVTFVFEILAAYYTETNILFLFFFQLAIQVTHFIRFDLEGKCMR